MQGGRERQQTPGLWRALAGHGWGDDMTPPGGTGAAGGEVPGIRQEVAKLT